MMQNLYSGPRHDKTVLACAFTVLYNLFYYPACSNASHLLVFFCILFTLHRMARACALLFIVLHTEFSGQAAVDFLFVAAHAYQTIHHQEGRLVKEGYCESERGRVLSCSSS